MSTPVLIQKGRETFVADLLDFLKRQAVDHLPPPHKGASANRKNYFGKFRAGEGPGQCEDLVDPGVCPRDTW